MMYLFSVPAIAIALCFFLLRFWLAIVTGMQRGLKRKWLWVPAVLVSPLFYLIVIQIDCLKSPNWRGWLLRVVVGGVVAAGLIKLGDSSLVNTNTLFAFKGTVATVFSDHVESVEGRVVRTIDGDLFETREDTPAFPNAFAVAGFAVLVGALQFYGPITKAICLAVFLFFCAAATQIVTFGVMVESFTGDYSQDWQNVVHDCRIFYNFHLWYLLMFGAAVMWAWSDIRYERKLAEQP